jgi:hypothetical protein
MEPEMTITAEKTFQGAWRISAMIGNERYSHQFFGCTKREAIAEFKAMARDTGHA